MGKALSGELSCPCDRSCSVLALHLQSDGEGVFFCLHRYLQSHSAVGDFTVCRKTIKEKRWKNIMYYLGYKTNSFSLPKQSQRA